MFKQCTFTRRFLYKKSIFAILIVFTYFAMINGIYDMLIALPYDTFYVHRGPREPLSKLVADMESNNLTESYLINRFTFKYLSVSDKKCVFPANEGGVNVIFLVKSSVGHIDNRNAVRETYGKVKSFMGNRIETVFLLGVKDLSPKIQIALEAEKNIHGDIVQADFLDSYENNTLKTTMALDWCYKQCKNVDFFVFVDDDYFVSIKNLFRYLKNPFNYPPPADEEGEHIFNSSMNLWAGYSYSNGIPVRHPSKWRIALELYPYDAYPPYIAGGMTVMSKETFKNIYYAYLFTELFVIDDVFIGMCAKKANITPTHNKEFVRYKWSNSAENYRDIISSHGFGDPQEMVEMWRLTQSEAISHQYYSYKDE